MSPHPVRPIALFFGTFLCLVLLAVAPSVAAESLEQEYQAASLEYRRALSLSTHEEKQAALEQCAQTLEELARKDSGRRISDRCYYLLGQCHHRIHDLNHSRKNLGLAIQNYRQVASRYPGSSLADDAQFLLGILYLHANPQQSYVEFKKVIQYYPKSDMAPKAQKKIEQLEKRLGCAPASSKEEEKKETTAREDDFQPPAKKARSARAEKKPPADCPTLHRITDIQHWSADEYTRVAIYTDAPVKFQSSAVPGNPQKNLYPKIHIDLEECGVNPSMKSEIAVMDPFLKDVRTEEIGQTSTRVTLDAQAIDKYRIFSLSDPFRIVIDVRGAKPQAKTSTRQPVPSPPKASGPSLAAQLALEVKKVVIDPGHGGKDKGAISPGGLYEKDVVLTVAHKLEKYLRDELGLEVVLTRRNDRFLSLEERTAIANTQKADLFISVHTNAHDDRSLHGTETYFLNLSKDQESARVAAMENATSRKKISDMEAILHDLMLNTKLDESSRLANSVQNNIIDALREGYEGVKDLGIKQAPFYVLLGAEMPSILIETAFITNEREEKRLKDSKFQDDLSRAIARGVHAYIQQMKGYAGIAGGDRS